MTHFVINQDADRSVYIKAQVEQVEHSTVSQLIDLSLCDMSVLGNLFFFCDLASSDIETRLISKKKILMIMNRLSIN